MKIFRCKDATWNGSAASVVLVLLLLSVSAQASDIRHIWQSRDQFVALASQDSGPESKPAPNNHPAEISQARLTAVLSSLEMRTSTSSKTEPLFTKESLDALVPQLQLGLRQALPGEDVTFAVVGLYKALYGFAKSPKVITGRLFIKNGQLNIIFGLVQQDVNEREDRRLDPFTPGKRGSLAPGDWEILPQAGQEMKLLRKDWVAFGEGWNVAAEQPAVPAAKTEPVRSTPAQPVTRHEDTRDPAERLKTLNDLKNKKLISDDEYRSKRLEILNGL